MVCLLVPNFPHADFFRCDLVTFFGVFFLGPLSHWSGMGTHGIHTDSINHAIHADLASKFFERFDRIFLIEVDNLCALVSGHVKARLESCQWQKIRPPLSSLGRR